MLAAAAAVDVSGFLAGFGVALAVLLAMLAVAAGFLIFRRVTGL